jgi:tetratricopeptide (TPR) repeat protein
MMKRFKIRSAAIALLFMGQSALAQGQAATFEDPGLLSLAVEVPASRLLLGRPETAGQPVIWRSYVERDELRLNLRFTNESEGLLWLTQAKLRQAVTVRVYRNGPMPVAVRWSDETSFYDERLPVVVAAEQVSLAPQTFVLWTVALKRQDGQTFGPGDYRIAVDLRDFRAVVRDRDGVVWNGRVPENGTREFVVRVELPTSKQEQALRYILDADEKAGHDQYAAALEDYSRAADVNPEDLSGLYGMAHMYRLLSRYREAIVLYEKIRNSTPGANERLPFFLALAYVGASENARAIDVLRTDGVPESEIPIRMQELRARVDFDRSNTGR